MRKMMMLQYRRPFPRNLRLPARVRGAALLFGVVAMVGCDSLLEVDLPGSIPESRLDDPSYADLISRSVIAAWECALTQHAGATGLLGTELSTSSNFSGRDHFDNRIRDTVANTGSGSTCPAAGAVYSSSGAQYVAMAMGRDVTRRFEAWTDAEVPNRTRHLATVTTYAAYAISIFALGYCEAVLEPNGPALLPADVLRVAEEWFTKG